MKYIAILLTVLFSFAAQADDAKICKEKNLSALVINPVVQLMNAEKAEGEGFARLSIDGKSYETNVVVYAADVKPVVVLFYDKTLKTLLQARIYSKPYVIFWNRTKGNECFEGIPMKFDGMSFVPVSK